MLMSERDGADRWREQIAGERFYLSKTPLAII